MPQAIFMGVSVNDFYEMTLTELKAVYEAHKMRAKSKDADMHIMHIYVNRAVTVAIENCFSRNPKLKCFEKPLMELEMLKPVRYEDMTEEQKKQEVDRIFGNLKKKADAFNKRHKKQTE